MTSSARTTRADRRAPPAALAAAAIAALVALASPVTRADDAPAPGGDVKARQLYDEGLRQYRLGDYDAALAHLEASYERAPSPALIYDMAQAHRLKGDCAKAAELYRRYLSAGAMAAVRERTQARITEMDACAAAREAAARQVVAAPAAPPPPASAPRAPPAAKPDAPRGSVFAAASVVADAPPPRPAWTTRLAHRPSALALTGGALILGSLAVYFAVQTNDASNQVSAAFQRGGVWSDADARAQSRGQLEDKLALASIAGMLLAGGTAAWLTWRH